MDSKKDLEDLSPSMANTKASFTEITNTEEDK